MAQYEHGTAKRKRESLDHEPEIFTRAADPELLLEVDIMILDYQAYKSTELLAANNEVNVTSSLLAVDSFLHSFRSRHPTYEPDTDLRFRLDLLQFHALYRLRGPVTLDQLTDLREERAQNAIRWIHLIARVPSSVYVGGSVLQDRETSPLSQSALECLCLLDLLPAFMKICATAYKHKSNHTEMVELMLNFMLQASLEQYLDLNASGSDTIDKAFAWGCFAEDIEPELKPMERSLHSMFLDPKTGIESELWTTAKKHTLDELLINTDAETSAGVESHLRKVAADHPIESFEQDLHHFLRECRELLELPVLCQIERGQLRGHSHEETQNFLTSCGVSLG